ncbi:hypothetical protein ACJRO7_004956 [Eucalyptus globulus]|uniref:RNase H type-1 domain-containing protein n=1 Tax=Eucalyptus globulus TaxID=34317 RepID=A0ABD3J3M8_EUCGL
MVGTIYQKKFAHSISRQDRNLLWQIWKERNDFVFRGTKPEVYKVIDLPKFQQASYQKWGFHRTPEQKFEEQQISLTWQAPKAGSFKINVDGSLCEGSMEGAMACVVRDSSGSLIDGFTKLVRAESVLQLETLGVLEALNLKYLKEKKVGEALVETDNQSVVNCLTKEEEMNWQARADLFECKSLLQQLPLVGLTYCPRSANAVMDWAARQQRMKTLPRFWWASPPLSL